MNAAKLEALISALEQAKGGPLMVKEIASQMGVSNNTAGKYVEIAQALGHVTTDYYGVAKRVWLRPKSPGARP